MIVRLILDLLYTLVIYNFTDPGSGMNDDVVMDVIALLTVAALTPRQWLMNGTRFTTIDAFVSSSPSQFSAHKPQFSANFSFFMIL